MSNILSGSQESALRAGSRLVIGPLGSGKTFLARQLMDKGVGVEDIDYGSLRSWSEILVASWVAIEESKVLFIRPEDLCFLDLPSEFLDSAITLVWEKRDAVRVFGISGDEVHRVWDSLIDANGDVSPVALRRFSETGDRDEAVRASGEAFEKAYGWAGYILRSLLRGTGREGFTINQFQDRVFGIRESMFPDQRLLKLLEFVRFVIRYWGCPILPFRSGVPSIEGILSMMQRVGAISLVGDCEIVVPWVYRRYFGVMGGEETIFRNQRTRDREDDGQEGEACGCVDHFHRILDSHGDHKSEKHCGSER